MTISLSNIGKRYNFEWIFRNVSLELKAGDHYVLLGSNGSGKSTLLQTIAGSLIPSEGSISYTINGKTIGQDDLYHHVSIAAPYLDLFEEMTLAETISFHGSFKPFYTSLTTAEILDIIGLQHAAEKQLRYFSSGMKQRVRLALAILSETSFLFLDEPTSNLDKPAISWYQSLVSSYSGNRIIIVASNQLEYEYPFCTQQILIEDYKQPQKAWK